jgi:hypothetical protein
MTELSEETKAGIRNLFLLPGKKKREKIKSGKQKRKKESEVILKAIKIGHRKECYGCLINCEVKHASDETFWAVKENIAPIYTLKDCPKMERRK